MKDSGTVIIPVTVIWEDWKIMIINFTFSTKKKKKKSPKLDNFPFFDDEGYIYIVLYCHNKSRIMRDHDQLK